MAYNKDNIFYKIIRKEIKSNTVLDEKHFIAIHDISPKSPVHILVIPKGCYVDYYDFVTNATTEEIVDIHKGVAKIIDMTNLNKGGYRLITNSGKFGMQEVMHFHIHVMGNASN
ncbi:MAG: HIT domain-containing protein [Holosporales bacterium]|jgi:diadenosine tetraphosphate (Ap4A) HIT family hydrolase|nr:HIT domain-containing protein [Holosporales bacterium]